MMLICDKVVKLIKTGSTALVRENGPGLWDCDMNYIYLKEESIESVINPFALLGGPAISSLRLERRLDESSIFGR